MELVRKMQRNFGKWHMKWEEVFGISNFWIFEYPFNPPEPFPWYFFCIAMITFNSTCLVIVLDLVIALFFVHLGILSNNSNKKLKEISKCRNLEWEMNLKLRPSTHMLGFIYLMPFILWITKTFRIQSVHFCNKTFVIFSAGLNSS